MKKLSVFIEFFFIKVYSIMNFLAREIIAKFPQFFFVRHHRRINILIMKFLYFCIRPILTYSLAEVFGRIKLHKKDLDFFTEESYHEVEVNFLVYNVLVINTFYVKYWSVLTQYQKMDPNLALTFLSKKNTYISRYIFLCNFVQPNFLIRIFLNGKIQHFILCFHRF